MSWLVLVRHGQASLFEPVYDRLSAAGEEQARRLGAFWAQSGLGPQEVYTGPGERHRRTAELAGRAMAEAGAAWPEAVVLQGLDEHAVDRLVTDSVDELSRRQPHIRALSRALERADEPAERQKAFQRLFEAVAALWVQDSWSHPDVDRWPVFRDRVRDAIRSIISGPGHGRRIAVVTSAGPISVALGLALECPDRSAIELGWRLHNTSLTEFVFTPDRLTLDRFNTLPHLRDASLWTYR